MPARRDAVSSPSDIECRCFRDDERRVLKFVLFGDALFTAAAAECACAIDGVAQATLVTEQGNLQNRGSAGIELVVPEQRLLHPVRDAFIGHLRQQNTPMVVAA